METWWGRAAIRPQTAILFSVSALDLLIERHESEWIISKRYITRDRTRDSTRKSALQKGSHYFEIKTLSLLESGHLRVKSGQAKSAWNQWIDATWSSMVLPLNHPGDEFLLSPVLLDGEFVFRFDLPLNLDPREKIFIGIQVPVRISLDLLRPQEEQRQVLDVGVEPLAKTWTGSSPLKGSLARTWPASTESQGIGATIEKLLLSDLLETNSWKEADFSIRNGPNPRLDRANLILALSNLTTEPLTIERVVIPCQKLSLYHSGLSGFWTDSVSVTYDSSGDELLHIEQAIPAEAGVAQRIAAPQETQGRNDRGSHGSFLGFEDRLKNLKNIFRDRG